MTTIEVGRVAGGLLGSAQTLQKMRHLANAALRDPLVIEQARRIVQQVPSRDYDAHAKAIRAFLAEHVQFVRDPLGQETLATPRYLLTEIGRRYIVQGDCDDAAILGAALAKAVGLRAKYVVLGFFKANAPFVHVYTVVKGRAGWHELDTTRAARRLVEAPITRVHSVEV